MLSLILHPDQIQQLAVELGRARDQEIGGVLVGEQLAPDAFRLVDVSVQRSGGTSTCFVCSPSAHRHFLEAFFERTGANYSRFNYLGEWHSHPRFTVAPSRIDLAQMQTLVDDEPERRPFAVLIVTRLAGSRRVEVCPIAFKSRHQPQAIDISVSPRPRDDVGVHRRTWVDRLFRSSSKLDVVVARFPGELSYVHERSSVADTWSDEPDRQ
jgi:proteasome lid subunit RPN8/RPN11